VPILTVGEPTATLLLENRDSRGAFNGNRLDTVSLLAGQLSVSITNALLYAALERKVTDGPGHWPRPTPSWRSWPPPTR
jgi:GAF domain-containing protein